MLTEDFLYRQNEFLIVAILLGLLLVATEFGFRRGRVHQSDMDHSVKSDYWWLQAGVMGLLALLLAFTFSMAISRYEIRKELLIDETNAIGSLYSRSRMLPEPYRSQVAKLVESYVTCRLRVYSKITAQKEIATSNRACLELQNQLSKRSLDLVAQNPAPVPSGMFVDSLDEVSSISLKRDAASENHVPYSVLIFLSVVTILTVGLLGYGCGLRNHRHLTATATVCFIISLVILIIIDIDRPGRGLITISQSPMIDLQSSLR